MFVYVDLYVLLWVCGCFIILIDEREQEGELPHNIADRAGRVRARLQGAAQVHGAVRGDKVDKEEGKEEKDIKVMRD
jgi:hypothetical protein